MTSQKKTQPEILSLADKFRALIRAQKAARKNYKRADELLEEIRKDPASKNFIAISKTSAARIVDLTRKSSVIWKNTRFSRYDLEVKSL